VDIGTVTDVIRNPPDVPGPQWRPGDAWLAGGTWLYSDPQPDLRRLIDLAPLGWQTLEVTADGLEIGATATIADLHALATPPEWTAAPLLRTSCEAFLASFKVWNSATVGGNICMALPAGPMITMTVALEATYELWSTTGTERVVDAAAFVTGNHATILQPGELLRRAHIPSSALRKHHAHRRFTLTKLGRSTIFVVGTRSPLTDDLTIVLTAGTTHPVRLRFDTAPSADDVAAAVDAIDDEVWFDDPNGSPGHRRHLARHYAEQIRTELADGVTA